LEEAYNSDLANGLGNLVARVAKLCEKSGLVFETKEVSCYPELEKQFENYSPQLALEYIWNTKIQEANKYVDEKQPWTLNGEQLKEVLERLVKTVREIAFNIKPFLPETSDKISEQFNRGRISAEDPLFPRI